MTLTPQALTTYAANAAAIYNQMQPIMAAAWARVAPAPDWKAPVDATVEFETNDQMVAEAKTIAEAIDWYTATRPRMIVLRANGQAVPEVVKRVARHAKLTDDDNETAQDKMERARGLQRWATSRAGNTAFARFAYEATREAQSLLRQVRPQAVQ